MSCTLGQCLLNSLQVTFKAKGAEGIKRFAMEGSKVSGVGNCLFHVRMATSEEPIPIAKYTLQPRLTSSPLWVRLAKQLSGTYF